MDISTTHTGTVISTGDPHSSAAGSLATVCAAGAAYINNHLSRNSASTNFKIRTLRACLGIEHDPGMIESTYHGPNQQDVLQRRQTRGKAKGNF